jgi:dynein heavy chain
MVLTPTHISILQLLPTPSKSHYTFNLRDLSKVFQGVLMAKPEKLESKLDLLRLWFHENCRVFQDRLVNDEDRKWFINLMTEKMTSGFDVIYEDVVDKVPLVYGDFMIPNSENKIYAEVTDYSKVRGNYIEIGVRYDWITFR